MKSSFSTWLYRIATNICIDQLRKKRFKVYPMTYQEEYSENNVGFVVKSDDNPEQEIERRETSKAIIEAVNQLPYEQKVMIVLRDIQEKSYNEIAEIMKLNLGTVKSRISRARMSLKEKLQNIQEHINDECV